MKLFRAADRPGFWIGEDKQGVLQVWPAKPRSWGKREGFVGRRDDLEEVDPALARGTGWPGGPVGRKPQADKAADTQVNIRTTWEERTAWEQTAERVGRRSMTSWARDELNAAVMREAGQNDVSPLAKPIGRPARTPPASGAPRANQPSVVTNPNARTKRKP